MFSITDRDHFPLETFHHILMMSIIHSPWRERTKAATVVATEVNKTHRPTQSSVIRITDTGDNSVKSLTGIRDIYIQGTCTLKCPNCVVRHQNVGMKIHLRSCMVKHLAHMKLNFLHKNALTRHNYD